jgi:hypothetical protein
VVELADREADLDEPGLRGVPAEVVGERRRELVGALGEQATQGGQVPGAGGHRQRGAGVERAAHPRDDGGDLLVRRVRDGGALVPVAHESNLAGT